MTLDITYTNQQFGTRPLQAEQVKRRKKINLGHTFVPYLFLAPALLFFVLFSYYPFLKTIYMSTTITDAQGQVKAFVGLKNFETLFARDEFLEILGNTLVFIPLTVIPTIIIGLALAALAEKKLRGFSGIAETLFTLPMATSSACAAIAWGMILNPVVGSLNQLLGLDINWLSDPDFAMLSVALVTVWMGFGFNFIILLTALRGVSPEIKESAMVDGANVFETFFKISLPMISPSIFFVVFTGVMSSFQAFGQINLLTRGGPGISTTVLVYDIYLEAFRNYRFGSASAESIVLFLMMLIFTLVQFRFEKKGVHYS